ncbi:prolyl aminopeptidase [Diaporthe amygdali]|uniref:prolyl aminopeptidase n=1 Tax=Phomopsis amygdali TaxID=1214568 RepID=UPI0022FEAD7E|nr:prolyl aminopeptidase [Diaporthe amygdali]KAJ0107762.1 prolyl aminopeptidase [Diaporthe amygdali]
MPPKPTFVLVPGAWHRPDYFAQIRAYLSDHGYPSVAVTTPTVGSDPPATTMDVDTDAVAAAVGEVLDAGKDVILMMHSYGGGPGTEATGKIAEELLRAGPGEGKGKIKRLIYVAAFIPIEGQPLGSPASVVPGFVPVYIDVGQDGNTTCNEKALEWMYDGLPEEEQQKHFKALLSHPLAPFIEPRKYVGWRYVPSTYVYAVKDKPVPLQFAEHMVKQAQKEDARQGGVQAFAGELGEVYMDCGHCAMFLVPEKVKELGKILVAAAEES